MVNARTLVAIGVILAIGPNQAAWSQDKKASTKIVVEKTKITFDPKTCVEGRGVIFWGHGSSSVKIIGQQDGHCVFEYIAEVEMGQAHYVIRVPVDSGPVTVSTDPLGMGITTSFPVDKSKVVRRGGGHGAWEVRVPGTDEFVGYRPGEQRSEMEPRPGDKVKFRVRVYDGREYTKVLPMTEPHPAVEFVVGSGKGWPWLETAMEFMTVGDRRQVHVPAKVAPDLRKWLTDAKVSETLYVELSLVSLERGK
jgi:hypothetical protein